MTAGNPNPIPTTTETEVAENVERRYGRYMFYTVAHRAIPRIEDGLKPVQRRLVLAAHRELNLLRKSGMVKAAKVLGSCMGTYHPHGEAYGPLVNMTQVSTTNHPMFLGQGNWGNTDNPPAAHRYTECKLAPIAEVMIDDLDFIEEKLPNYDDTVQEEQVLAASIPWIWLNETIGIAVGIGTALLPHNLGEVVDATVSLIKNPASTPADLCKHLKAPDFIQGGYITPVLKIGEESWHPYATGKGSFRFRVPIEKEQVKANSTNVVIKAIPPKCTRKKIVEEIVALCEKETLTNIKDVIDASDCDGTKIIIEPKSGANLDVIISNLYKYTSCEKSVSMHCVALIDGRPETFTLKRGLQCWIDFRRMVVSRRFQAEVDELSKKIHSIEGILKVLSDIKRAVKIITESDDPDVELAQAFGLSPEQVKSVFAMTVRSLTKLNRQNLLDELKDKTERRAYCMGVLGDPTILDNVIIEELKEIKRKYAKPRATKVVDSFEELTIKDLVIDESIIITLDSDNMIKRMPVGEYRQQKRKGKGLAAGSGTSFITKAIQASAHDDVLIISDKGRCYYMPAYAIPEASRNQRGCSVFELPGVDMVKGEGVAVIMAVDDLEDGNIFLATDSGTVKRTEASQFRKNRKAGLTIMSVDDDERIIAACLEPQGKEQCDAILFTSGGLASRFSLDAVRVMGRGAAGVKGIRLRDSDKVISGAVIRKGDKLQTIIITSNAFGKLFDASLIQAKGRGSQGVQVGSSAGSVACAAIVTPQEAADATMFITTDAKKAIRIPVSEIKEMSSRGGKGTQLVALEKGTSVTAATVIAEIEPEGEGE